MDPDAALKQIVDLVDNLMKQIDHDLSEEELDTNPLARPSNELIDAFNGLNMWMAGGGRLPKAWLVNRNCHRRS